MTIRSAGLRTDSAAQRRTLARAAGVAAFALLIALAAQARAYLPGSPVPHTMQTLAVVLAGVSLGPWLGIASVALYLLVGAIGLPVFAAGNWGPLALLGSTAGYLVGFVAAQPVIHAVMRRGAHSPLSVALASLAGHAVILTLGAAWLLISTPIDAATALAIGVAPFLVGTALKTVLAAGLAPLTKRIHGHLG